jgi:hypothetical protein
MHWRAAYVQPASCWKTTVRSLVISLAGNAALAEGLHGTLRCCLAVLADNNSLEMLVSQYGPLQSSHCYGCWDQRFPAHSVLQQQSKVDCIQTCALLYIAAFCCTPNCHDIVSQLITGNYVIKFERNSFRVQLSAKGIATCFASAQPKAHYLKVWIVFVCRLCLLSKSNSNHSGKFSGTCK